MPVKSGLRSRIMTRASTLENLPLRNRDSLPWATGIRPASRGHLSRGGLCRQIPSPVRLLHHRRCRSPFRLPPIKRPTRPLLDLSKDPPHSLPSFPTSRHCNLLNTARHHRHRAITSKTLQRLRPIQPCRMPILCRCAPTATMQLLTNEMPMMNLVVITRMARERRPFIMNSPGTRERTMVGSQRPLICPRATIQGCCPPWRVAVLLLLRPIALDITVGLQSQCQ